MRQAAVAEAGALWERLGEEEVLLCGGRVVVAEGAEAVWADGFVFLRGAGLACSLRVGRRVREVFLQCVVRSERLCYEFEGPVFASADILGGDEPSLRREVRVGVEGEARDAVLDYVGEDIVAEFIVAQVDAP